MTGSARDVVDTQVEPKADSRSDRTTLGALLRRTEDRLGPGPEARWVLAASSGVPVSRLLARPDAHPGAQVVARLETMLGRLERGEPLQYVLGTWEFRTLELVVDERVLIPRPETEQVVSHALAELSGRREQSARQEQTTRRSDSDESSARLVADLGTGSGAIALSVAAEHGEQTSGHPDAAEIWATDLSGPALEVAAANLRRLAERDPCAASCVHLSEGDWFDALPRALEGCFDLIVSNPPYVSRSEWSCLDPQVRDHEPRLALVGGEAGTEALDVLVEGSTRWLGPGASLVLELAPGQAPHVVRRARAAGFVGVEVGRDLAGNPRALVARMPL